MVLQFTFMLSQDKIRVIIIDQESLRTVQELSYLRIYQDVCGRRSSGIRLALLRGLCDSRVCNPTRGKFFHAVQ